MSENTIHPAITPAPIPNPVPLFAIGWNMPGYLPDPDSTYITHVRIYSPEHFSDDIRRVTNLLAERMIEQLEDSADSLESDAESDDSAEFEAATSDRAMAETLATDREGWRDLQHGIARAVRDGREYGYRVTTGDGSDAYFFVAPVTESGAVCTDYESGGRCDGNWCGRASVSEADLEAAAAGGVVVVDSSAYPAAPTGYMVTVDYDEGADSPREWSTASLWAGCGTSRYREFEEGDSGLFGRHGSALDVWERLTARYDEGAAYEMFRLLCRVHGYACAPLSRGYGGTVSVGDTGTPGHYRGCPGRIFKDIHVSVDGVAVIDPSEVQENNALTGSSWLPVISTPAPGSVLGPEFDPARTRDIVDEECAIYNQWADGDVYRFTVDRVDLNASGRWSTAGVHVDSCGGFYGDDHIASGLANAVLEFAPFATPSSER